jgi:hypothetical protein
LTHFETLSALDLRLLLRLGLLALFTLLLASGSTNVLALRRAIVAMPSATSVLGNRRSCCDARE